MARGGTPPQQPQVTETPVFAFVSESVREAELDRGQAWLDRRLRGLTPEDFEGDVRIFGTAGLQPPEPFRSTWSDISGWEPQEGERLLTDEEAVALRAVLIFCNQNDQEELHKLGLLVSNIDALGESAPPMFWVPHSGPPEEADSGPRREESRSFRHVPIALARQHMRRGVDGLLSGEPEGVRLALAVQAKMQSAATLSRNLQNIMVDAQSKGNATQYIKEARQLTLWDYARVRLAPEVPAVNTSLPYGEPQGLPGFAFGQKLGQGALGSVYLLAEDPDVGNPAQAVKVVPKTAFDGIEDIRWLNRMIHVMRLLSDPPEEAHEGLAILHEVYHSHTHIIFRMEYGGPMDLCRRLSLRQAEDEQHRPLPLDKVLPILRQLGDVVSYLHAVARVCHRDLKPENIILNELPDSVDVKLADFDVAVCVERGGPLCHRPCGMLPYAAPEVVLERGYDGHAADIWSLGVVFAEIFCGLQVVEQAVGLPAVDQNSVNTESPKIAESIRDHFQKCHAASKLLEERCRIELLPLKFSYMSLLNRMLRVTPSERICADNVLEAVWRGPRECPPEPVAPSMSPPEWKRPFGKTSPPVKPLGLNPFRLSTIMQ